MFDLDTLNQAMVGYRKAFKCDPVAMVLGTEEWNILNSLQCESHSLVNHPRPEWYEDSNTRFHKFLAYDIFYLGDRICLRILHTDEPNHFELK